MGFFDSLLKIGLPILGSAVGGPLGGAIGGAAAGGIDIYQTGQAQKKQQQDRDDANNANNARYNQAIGLYSDTLKRAREMNAQISDQDVQDINQSYDELGRNLNADLGARGLSNTTIAPTLQQGVVKERAGALNRANDTRLKRTIQIDSDLTGDLARTIERRVDVGPSEKSAENLAAAAGQAEAAVGGNLKAVLEEMQKRKKPDAGESSQLLQGYAPGFFDSLLNSQQRFRYA